MSTTTEKWDVYLITNLVNGKNYVGATKRLRKRRLEHFSMARRGLKYPICQAIHEYGAENFDFIVLRECASQAEAFAAEVELIEAIRPAYNIADGGKGGSAHRGHKHTAEARAKMSRALKGKPGPWLGKKRSPETIEKISTTKRAAPTPVKCLELLATHQKAAVEKSAAMRRRRVICLSDGAVYPSAHAAAAHYGCQARSINRVASGDPKCKTVYGLRFAYGGGDA